MLEGAPDQRLYRQFTARSRAEAEAQARAYSLDAALAGLRPVADRWDAQRGVLSVAYASPVPAGAAGVRSARLAPALSVVVLVVTLGLLLGLLPPAQGEGVAAGQPSAGTSPRPRTSPRPSTSQRPSPPRPTAAAWSGPLPHYSETDCRSDWTFGRETVCGDLIVLEDRSKPSGAQVTLHVAIHRTYSRQARPDPVVYLEGGPGGAPLLDGFWAYPFLDDRDLIVFDQRGTGLAHPTLDCNEVDGLFAQDELAAVRRCHARLKSRGIELAAYNSAASAADLEDLRLALGYEQWNLYGVSYGTRLALTALRDHPAGLRSVILDSVYPPQVDIYGETPANAQRAFDKLFAACAAAAACAEAYPGLEERFYQLAESLEQQPQRVGGGFMGLGSFEVDGQLLLDYIFQNMYSTDYLPDLPLELGQFLDGEWAMLDSWYAFMESTYWSNFSEGMHYSVQCSEELPFADRAALAAEPAGVRPVVTRAFGWQSMVDICEVWQVLPGDAHENLPVTSDVPVLLLAGTYDPITPPAWAEAAAEHLSAAQLVVVEGVGHGVLGTSYCVDEIVSSFLEQPQREAQLDCLDSLVELEFRLPN